MAAPGFEPLTSTFRFPALNRTDLFLFQRVYGITTATIKVGYEYSGCEKNVWHIQTAKLSGHDMPNTDIGGWNLHVQHKYNFHSGILQKGDGNTVYLKYKPQVGPLFLFASGLNRLGTKLY